MQIVSPAANARFTIAADTTAPVIDVRTDAAGPHVWDWSIRWGTYQKAGQARTPDNVLHAASLIVDLGGTLTVTATSGTGAAARRASLTVAIVGTNPAAHDVTSYLATKPDSVGFAAILQHESRARHFTATGEPIRSFDAGYGICQLTSPVPTYEQCWSWKRNIDGGLALFAQKVRTARAYLSQSGRTFTDDQLTREAVCRWNGGAYHGWNGTAWVRNPNILCDSTTGNIGWDMTRPGNSGQTEAQLHQRDREAYRRPPPANAGWMYSGVCYADAILG